MTARLFDLLDAALWPGPGAWPGPLQAVSFALCALIGAVCASPVWEDDWAQWQRQQAAQDRHAWLQQALSDLQADAIRDSPASPASLTDDRISQVAQAAGLQVLTVASEAAAPTWDGDTDAAGLGWRSLHLQMQGTFAQGADAWQRLVDLAPTLHWTDWQVQALPSGDLRFDWHLRVPQPAASASRLTSGVRAAFDPRRWRQVQAAHAHPQLTGTRRHSGLEHLSWQDLRYVGHVRGKHGVRALLRVPSAQGLTSLHAVAVGDDLGPNLGRITRIDEDAVWVQTWQRAPGGLWQSQRRRVPLDGAAS